MSTAGKTKLLTRYIYGSFNEQGLSTQGVDYSIVKQIGAKFGYYDTAGQ
jgi:GTPase SAR1 family protein